MDAHAIDRAAGINLMIYIVLIAVIGILLLHSSGAVEPTDVAIAYGLVALAAAPAVGIHEAWTKKRACSVGS